jgi:hypothetical protein
MARPTKYDKRFIKNVNDYLIDCEDQIEEYHRTRGEKSDTYDRLVHVKLPTVEGFARYIGVNKTTLYEWADRYAAFSNALELIVSVQKDRLINHGLSGDYNPVIAKLILSANHGMSEKYEVKERHTLILDEGETGTV